jgi:transposase
MKKFRITAASVLAALVLGFVLALPSANAATRNKVDCDKVMSELGAGKKAKEVAKDLGISASSVYRCKKKAAAAAGTTTTASKPPSATKEKESVVKGAEPAKSAAPAKH